MKRNIQLHADICTITCRYKRGDTKFSIIKTITMSTSISLRFPDVRIWQMVKDLLVSLNVSLLVSLNVSLLVPLNVSLLVSLNVRLLVSLNVSLLVPLNVSLLVSLNVSLLVSLNVSLLVSLNVSLLVPLNVSLLVPLNVSLLVSLNVSLLVPLNVSLLVSLNVSLLVPLNVSLLVPLNVRVFNNSKRWPALVRPYPHDDKILPGPQKQPQLIICMTLFSVQYFLMGLTLWTFRGDNPEDPLSGDTIFFYRVSAWREMNVWNL